VDRFLIREMKLADYSAVVDLWEKTPGLALSDADSEKHIDLFLKRNQGFSFVAEAGNRIIGTVLCGHDGRRGFIYHLAVYDDYRKKGIGRNLVDRCLIKLADDGIAKCHLFVLEENNCARLFWGRIGFCKRDDIYIYSKNL